MSLVTVLELTPLISAVLLYAIPKGNTKLIKQAADRKSVV